MKYLPQEMCQEGHWIAAMDDIDFIRDNEVIFSGSFQVLGSRLLGLSYPDYLRFLQSQGATLKGKEGYCYGYFKDKAACQKVCNLLNAKWKKVVGGITNAG